MWQFILAHQLVVGIISMWFVGNAVSALPTPKSTSSGFYDWFFRFMQPIGAAIPRLLAVYTPSTLSALTGQTPNGQSNGQASHGVGNGQGAK